MGENLPVADLGSDADIKQVVLGNRYTCVLLDGGIVKCFGRAPGYGDLVGRGSIPGQMGENLPAIDLGTDFDVVQLTSGEDHTCALSRQGNVKCWGLFDARLGLGRRADYQLGGFSASEMGDRLPALDLGPAVQLDAGWWHTCALLANGFVRCWGWNENGELGHGGTERFGDEPGEMGDSLPFTRLGDGLMAVRVAAGGSHGCALLQDASVKCWGWGVNGQLGQGSTETLGDEPWEMGNALRSVNLANRRVLDLSLGFAHTCVLLDDDSTRCWGSNSVGDLGIGTTTNVGAIAGQMGTALLATELFPVMPGAELEGFILTGDGSLHVQYNGSLGLVCDDGFDEAAARIACRDLGMAGGVAFSSPVETGDIFADNVRCLGSEVSLRQCRFRGWHLHDCTPQEAVGLQCEMDAWSDYTVAGPAERQDHSMVWDQKTQSTVMFGGHASSAFLYYADLWIYRWNLRTWTQILAQDQGPGTRSGHVAVWDAVSKSMLVFAGRYLGTFYQDIWRFYLETSFWARVSVTQNVPAARAYHSAIWDDEARAMIIYAGGDGENRAALLNDLQRFSLDQESWTTLAEGPGARSRHTAVWDAMTKSMLVFGGWTGEQYLAELHRYDAWANTWEALLAGSGFWPSPRGGHSAAWDPVSMSMLVFGGIQNTTSTDSTDSSLSYDARLFNYTLLTGVWTEEGLRASVPGPKGRTGQATVWDQESRGLISFAGFDSSYLSETWRYVVSQTQPPLLARCHLGQECAPAQNDSILASATAKHLCSDPEALDTHDDSGGLDNHSGASPLFIEPGHHRFCGCDANCSHPADFQIDLGHFIVEGPYLNQSAQCDLGSVCIISEWRGVGIAVNDSVILQSKCRTKEASAHHRRADISFNESMSWFELHVGFLDNGIGPQVVELCWCPASRPCASAQEFLVTALQLRLVCPPGQYELSEACQACPVDHYCPGGEQVYSCPAASTAPAGSSQLSDCKCLKGRYWDAGACRICPAGSTTSHEGARDQNAFGVYSRPRDSEHLKFRNLDMLEHFGSGGFTL